MPSGGQFFYFFLLDGHVKTFDTHDEAYAAAVTQSRKDKRDIQLKCRIPLDNRKEMYISYNEVKA